MATGRNYHTFFNQSTCAQALTHNDENKPLLTAQIDLNSSALLPDSFPRDLKNIISSYLIETFSDLDALGSDYALLYKTLNPFRIMLSSSAAAPYYKPQFNARTKESAFSLEIDIYLSLIYSDKTMQEEVTANPQSFLTLLLTLRKLFLEARYAEEIKDENLQLSYLMNQILQNFKKMKNLFVNSRVEDGDLKIILNETISLGLNQMEKNIIGRFSTDLDRSYDQSEAKDPEQKGEAAPLSHLAIEASKLNKLKENIQAYLIQAETTSHSLSVTMRAITALFILLFIVSLIFEIPEGILYLLGGVGVSGILIDSVRIVYTNRHRMARAISMNTHLLFSDVTVLEEEQALVESIPELAEIKIESLSETGILPFDQDEPESPLRSFSLLNSSRRLSRDIESYIEYKIAEAKEREPHTYTL